MLNMTLLKGALYKSVFQGRSLKNRQYFYLYPSIYSPGNQNFKKTQKGHKPPVSQTRLKPSPGLKCKSELF